MKTMMKALLKIINTNINNNKQIIEIFLILTIKKTQLKPKSLISNK